MIDSDYWWDEQGKYQYPDVYKLIDFIIEFNVTEFDEIRDYALSKGLDSWVLMLEIHRHDFFERLFKEVRIA